MSAALRKAPETKTMIFPALVSMMTEVEMDQEVWATTDEDPEMVNSDPVSTAISSLTRLSDDLGEKTTLACA